MSTPHENATAGSVALVFHRDFSASLHPLACRIHVWVVDTPENSRAAALVRSAADAGCGVTAFNDLPKPPTAGFALAILDTVIEHHPSCTRLEVFGAPTFEGLPAALTLRGFQLVSPRDERIEPRVFRRAA